MIFELINKENIKLGLVLYTKDKADCRQAMTLDYNLYNLTIAVLSGWMHNGKAYLRLIDESGRYCAVAEIGYYPNHAINAVYSPKNIAESMWELLKDFHRSCRISYVEARDVRNQSEFMDALKDALEPANLGNAPHGPYYEIRFKDANHLEA